MLSSISIKNSNWENLTKNLVTFKRWDGDEGWGVDTPMHTTHSIEHSIDLQSKSWDWFLHDRDLRHERLKVMQMKKIKILE